MRIVERYRYIITGLTEKKVEEDKPVNGKLDWTWQLIAFALIGIILKLL